MKSENPNSHLSPAFFIGSEIVQLQEEQLRVIIEEATCAPFRRARFCLHQECSDALQEMVIVQCRDSFTRVHRHLGKVEFSESFHIISGELLVVIFSDDGQIIKHIEMAPPSSGKTFLYRLASTAWHTVVPLSDIVIYHETSVGPFIKADVEFADWSPTEKDHEGIALFLKGLHSKIAASAIDNKVITR